jgi:hypothetical protein
MDGKALLQTEKPLLVLPPDPLPDLALAMDRRREVGKRVWWQHQQGFFGL